MNFKDRDDYLDLMRDATEDYKASLKKVNLDFDVEYYDKLILEANEPQTPASEDPIGLNPIGTPGTAAGSSTLGEEVVASTLQATEQPAGMPVDPPTDQPTVPSTTRPADPPAAQPIDTPTNQKAA